MIVREHRVTLWFVRVTIQLVLRGLLMHLLHRLLHLLHRLTVLCINQCLDIASQSVCFWLVHSVYLQNICSTGCINSHEIPKNSFLYSDWGYLSRVHSLFISQPKQNYASTVKCRYSVSIDSNWFWENQFCPPMEGANRPNSALLVFSWHALTTTSLYSKLSQVHN